MRLQQWAMVAALTVAVPSAVWAQSGRAGMPSPATRAAGHVTLDSPTGTINGRPGTVPGRTATVFGQRDPGAAQQGGADTFEVLTAPSSWIASGFVGSSFGASTDDSAADFGGSLGYLWRSTVGGEFIAGFTPNFNLQNNLMADNQPQVNSYMVNAIGAIPIGVDAQWQPFVSGGFGAVTLGSSLDDDANSTFDPNETRAGGNIGAGVMGFVGNWGVRGDVRYFRAFERDEADGAAQELLPGLDFWRANIGLAVRW